MSDWEYEKAASLVRSIEAWWSQDDDGTQTPTELSSAALREARADERAKIVAATAALDERLAQIGGCGNGNCKVHIRPGMHTNGGCRCLSRYGDDPTKAERVVSAYRAFRLAIERGGKEGG